MPKKPCDWEGCEDTTANVMSGAGMGDTWTVSFMLLGQPGLGSSLQMKPLFGREEGPSIIPGGAASSTTKGPELEFKGKCD